jgi:membrane protease YdiL (CAAX protease family)
MKAQLNSPSNAQTPARFVLLRVCLFYVSALIVLLFTSAAVTKSLPPRQGELLSILLATVLSAILVYAFTRWSKLSLKDVGVVPGPATVARFTCGFFVGLSLAIAQAAIVWAGGHLQLVQMDKLQLMDIVMPFTLYVIVACREELVFRSYALQSLRYRFTRLFALVFITVIFIMEHVVSGMSWTMSIIGSGLGGILFAVAALKTRGLALPLGLHSAWNFGQWIMGFKDGAGVWRAVVDKGYEAGTERLGLAVYSALMILAIACVLVFYRQKEMRAT